MTRRRGNRAHQCQAGGYGIMLLHDVGHEQELGLIPVHPREAYPAWQLRSSIQRWTGIGTRGQPMRPVRTLLHSGAIHAHKDLTYPVQAAVMAWVSVNWGPGRGMQCHPTAQTCSWQTTTGHGRPACSPGIVAAAAPGHAHLPSCGAPAAKVQPASSTASSTGCGIAHPGTHYECVTGVTFS